MAVRAPVTLDLLLVGSASATVETALDRTDADSFDATLETVPDGSAARDALEAYRHDGVVVSTAGTEADAATVVETVRDVDSDLPVVVVDDEATVAPAVAAGATDGISRSLVEERPRLLVDRVRRAVEAAPGNAVPGSRSWYEALLVDSMDALTVLDGDGTISYQNPSVERLLGYDPEALVGTDSLEYVHPDDRDRVEETFVDLYERGDDATADLEFRFRAADGTWEWLESVVTARTERGIEGYVVNSSVVTERKAREREVERFETLLSVVPDTIAITDLEGYHVEVYGCEGWSGYEPGELLGEHVSKTTPEAEIERAEEIIEELIRDDDREKATFETTLVTRDGEPVPFEDHVRPLPSDDDGDVPGLLHVLRNVADRREREHRLEAAETVFENVQDGVFLAELTPDGEFRFQRVNPAYHRAAPLGDADVVGKTPTEAAGPEIGRAIEARLRECVEERSAIEFERELALGVETTYWHNRLAPVVEDGEAVGVVGVLRDVTERTERERELRLKNRAMDEAPIGITVSTATEEGAELVYANQGYETLTGYSVADLEGDDWWRDLFGEETDTDAVASLEATLDEEGHASAELQLYRKDGTPRWFQVSVSPLTDEAGAVTHFVSFQHDITERKEYETEIERRFDEFADVFAEDLREPIERARSSVDAARTNGEEEALEDATEWLDRADDLLADLVTVHSFSVPSRDHSESALQGRVDGE